MRKILTFLFVLMCSHSFIFGQLGELELHAEVLGELASSSKVLASLEDVTPEQIDSVVAEFSMLEMINRTDLDRLYTYLVPSLFFPSLEDNKEYYKQCISYSEIYIELIMPIVPLLVEKSGKGTVEIYADNFKRFFPLLILKGLNNTVGLKKLEEYPESDINQEQLEELIKFAIEGESKGESNSELLDVFKFIRLNSFVPLLNNYSQ